VALASELTRRRQAGRARADDGEAERGRRHGRRSGGERGVRSWNGKWFGFAVLSRVFSAEESCVIRVLDRFVHVGVGDLEGRRGPTNRFSCSLDRDFLRVQREENVEVYHNLHLNYIFSQLAFIHFLPSSSFLIHKPLKTRE
jgi:hypothetical protein